MNTRFLVIATTAISILLFPSLKAHGENNIPTDSILKVLFNNDSSFLTGTSLKDIQDQALKSDHKLIFMDGKPDYVSQQYVDSVKHLINMFYYDQFRSFSDPAAPYFMFMSKDAKLAMGIGGCVRMRGWFDWGGAIPVNGFAPYLIPMTPDPCNKRKFGTTPSGSTLYFRVLGRDKRSWDYQLYIEANFNGWDGLGFHLKKAYAQINSVTIGYAESSFSDPMALPPTVDAQGPNNKLSPTSVLVRWMHPFKKHFTTAISLETPNTRYTISDTLTKKAADWTPDLAAFFQYAWGKSEHIRLSGVLRTLSYRSIEQEKNHTLLGWGLQLSGIVHPLRPVTIYGNICAGKGYEGLGGDLQIGNYDLVPEPDNPNKLYPPFALGWNVCLQYNFKPNLFASATYSQTRYMPKGKVADSEYKLGQYVAVNLFWNLTPRIMAGAEYDFGVRKDFNGLHRNAQRIGAVAQFAF